MTAARGNGDQVNQLLARLPEKEFALYILGSAVRFALMDASSRRTEADIAFIEELARRVADAESDLGRAELQRWFAPGGALRWSK